MNEKKNQKKKVLILVLVLGLVLLTIGGTYAFFTYTRQGQKENTLTTGVMYFVYDELSEHPDNHINITNAFPKSDDDGKVQKGEGVFDFEVRADTAGADINYEIYLTKDEGSTLPEYVVKTYLTKVTNMAEVESETPVPDIYNNSEINLYNKLGMSKVPTLGETEGRTLYQGKVTDGQKDYSETYRYRMWIDEEANKMVNGSWKYNDMTFSVKVNVYAQNDEIDKPTIPETYKDESGANYPDLVEGLIPVYYKDGEWHKADLYKDWYDYDIQEWANAVTVTSESREQHNSDSAGSIIPITDINTMWVWIPRYEYDYQALQKLGSTPGKIDVKFIDTTKTDVTEKAEYKVHPAFTFGNDELTGIWYAKFESSTSDECNENAETCNNSDLKPKIIPNATSWRYLQNATAFAVSQEMGNDTTEYGFTGKNVDTHVSKNSEWGAVAYLSQSKYGKYGNDGEEVYINNCSNYITGIAGNTADASSSSDTCTKNTYQTRAGQKASTTGNITGVYDMNGGAWERVMGVLEDSDNPTKPILASSGFVDELGEKQIPVEKYYDLYTTSNPDSQSIELTKTACDGEICYGHALSETLGWYGDFQAFINSSYAWLARGGHYLRNTTSGLYSYGGNIGDVDISNSFRIALVSVRE